jgi:hypothetical protein
MMSKRFNLAIGLSVCLFPSLWAQSVRLPMEPLRDTGQSVTGAFEGWFQNADGSFSMLVGYFNRNLKQDLDIPVGPANSISPGGPDRGQPTHFMSGRQWGVFVVNVPKEFGGGKLIWTLVANGQATSIPLSLNPLWEISPFSETGIGNTPPVVRFSGGTPIQGPRSTVGATLAAVVGKPVPIKLRAVDDAKVGVGAIAPTTAAVGVTFLPFRGPSPLVIGKPAIEKISSAPYEVSASTTATFSEPGDYTVLVVANDWSGDGGRGFQCCWTTAQVKVSVRGQ